MQLSFPVGKLRHRTVTGCIIGKWWTGQGCHSRPGTNHRRWWQPAVPYKGTLSVVILPVGLSRGWTDLQWVGRRCRVAMEGRFLTCIRIRGVTSGAAATGTNPAEGPEQGVVESWGSDSRDGPSLAGICVLWHPVGQLPDKGWQCLQCTCHLQGEEISPLPFQLKLSFEAAGPKA